jgi:hypothetical protein
MTKLHRKTITNTLWYSLNILMQLDVLKNFRLVGGTSLSLQIGHRMSVDIDLFTDLAYDSLDFKLIDEKIIETFPVVQMGFGGDNSMGKSYYVGVTENDLVKLDLFYTDRFVFPELKINTIRLASKEEIVAMKLEVIGYGGRKKDFWDLHELLEYYSLSEMIAFYKKRYQYGHSKEELILMLGNFDNANEDFDPICLHKKKWELIKLDFEEKIQIEF